MWPSQFAGSGVPLTQNTAQVLEFRCLFTSDLRKKQKKWQDGRLKFHAFNKRIMVYDDRTNYVGDTHFHAHSLEEGEELELERGVLVEVGELLQRHEQDLGQLMGSVTAGKSTRQASIAPERGGTPAGMRRQYSIAPSGTSRSLSSLLGTPSGHHGRALLPITSPFEDRHNAMRQASKTPEPASKKRRIDAVSVRKELLWERTSKAQPRMGNDNIACGRQMPYPASIAAPSKVAKAYEKPTNTGYAQKLAPAVVSLSGSGPQESRPTPARQPIGNSEPESDDDVVMVGSRSRSPNASARPKVNLKEIFQRASSKPTRQIVYPDSIAPARKERKEYEKPSKGGYAQKLAPAVLNLSSSNMSNLHARKQKSKRERTPGHWIDDSTGTPSSGSRHRPIEVEGPQSKKQTAILPPSRKIIQPVSKEIVYPHSISPKKKVRNAYERKSKESYAPKLTGSSIDLSGAIAIKPSLRAKIDDPNRPLSSDDENEMDVNVAAPSRPAPIRQPPRKKARHPTQEKEPMARLAAMRAEREEATAEAESQRAPEEERREMERRKAEKQEVKPRRKEATKEAAVCAVRESVEAAKSEEARKCARRQEDIEEGRKEAATSKEANPLAAQKKKDALFATISNNVNTTKSKTRDDTTAAPTGVMQEKESLFCTQPDDFVALDEVIPKPVPAIIPPEDKSKSNPKSSNRVNEAIPHKEEQSSFILDLDAPTLKPSVAQSLKGKKIARNHEAMADTVASNKTETAPPGLRHRLTLKERMFAGARKKAEASLSVTTLAQEASPLNAAPSPVVEASRASSVGSASTADTSQKSAPPVVGSLRIRSKPKRNMFIMQQSVPYRSAMPQEIIAPGALPTEKSKVSKPKTRAIHAEGVVVADNTVPHGSPSRVSTNPATPQLSQAAKKLQDFEAKQKEKLAARKKMIEQKKKDSAIEIMSSPPQDDRQRSSDLPDFVDEEDDDGIMDDGDDAMDVNLPSSLIILDKTEPILPSKPVRSKLASSKTSPSMNTKKVASALRQTSCGLNNPQARPSDEESGISYTAIDNLLHLNPLIRPLTRSTKTPFASSRAREARKRPEPSQTMSSPPAFTQFSQREKVLLPTFGDVETKAGKGNTVATKGFKQYLERAKVVPPSSFLDTQAPQLQPQASQVAFSAIEYSWGELPAPVARVLLATNTTRSPGPTFSSVEPESQPIRPTMRRQARLVKSRSPSVVLEDDPHPGFSSPRGATPSVQSSSDMQDTFIVDDCPSYLRSQAEETDDDGNDGSRDWTGRELSMVEGEQLRSGQPILVKIKSGIRSKEIIRPKKVMKRKPSVVYRYERSPESDPPEHREKQKNRYGPGSCVVDDEDEMDVFLEMETSQGSRCVVGPSNIQDGDDAMQSFWEAETAKPEIQFRKFMMGPPHAEDEAPPMPKAELFQPYPKLDTRSSNIMQPLVISKSQLPKIVEREVDVVPATQLELVVKVSPTQALDKASQELTVVMEMEEKAKLEKNQPEEDAKAVREQREGDITLQKEALEQETKARLAREAMEEKARREAREAQEALEQAGLLKQQEDERARLLTLQVKENTRLEAEEAREKARLLKLKRDNDARKESPRAEEAAILEKQRVEEGRIAKQEANQQARLKRLAENEAKIQRLEAEQRARAERQAAEARAMRVRAEEARVKREKEGLEEKVMNDKLEVETKAQRDKGEIEEKARKERLDAVEKLRRERHTFRVPSLRKDGSSSSGTVARQPIQILALPTAPSSEDGSTSVLTPRPTISSYKAPTPRLPPSYPTSIGPRAQALMQGQPPLSSIEEEIARRDREVASLERLKSPFGEEYVPPDMSSAGSSFVAPLVLSTPAVRPFKAPKSVPIVERPKTMAEVRNEQWAERERERKTRGNLVYWPGKEERGKIGEWEEGAWTAEAGDLFDWKPKVGDERVELA